MTEKQLHDTAIRLLEGGREYYNGHWIRAIEVKDDVMPCTICYMDSICSIEFTKLCIVLDCISYKRYMIVLADGQ